MKIKSKNIKGLTIVEILASVVIAVMVMTYGINLFIASWRLESDNEDYHKALTYVANVVEHARALRNVNDIINSDTKDAVSKAICPPEYKKPGIKLPSGTDIYIEMIVHSDKIPKLEKFDNNGKVVKKNNKTVYESINIGVVPISVIATWYRDNDKNKKEEKIIINTYIGSNDTFDYFGYNENTILDDDGKIKIVDKNGNILG